MRHTITLFFLLCMTCSVFAEEVKTLSGSATYYGTSKESRVDCERAALDMARISALEKEYGRIISQDVANMEMSQNGKESNFFQVLNYAEVKGEWLADVGEPKFTVTLDNDNNFVVSCDVKIKARAYTNKAVDFAAETLCNGTAPHFKSNRFKHKDQMFLSFRAPVSGYLAVYLAAEDGRVYTLFPYITNVSGNVKLKGNTDYVLFNEKDLSLGEAMPLELLTDEDLEINHLYVIFSPNEFTQALDEASGANIPRSLTFSDFNKWVSKIRSHDEKMGMKRITISITNS